MWLNNDYLLFYTLIDDFGLFNNISCFMSNSKVGINKFNIIWLML